VIHHIIWDWNGTLLDDVDCCVDTLNSLLLERSIPPVSRSSYVGAFGFPVRAYYEGLGFDFEREDFGQLSVDFIARYRARLSSVVLHPSVLSLLATLQGRLRSQRVVSAMEHSLLGEMLHSYGVAPFLQSHHGTSDLQAGSKVEVGRRALAQMGAHPDEVLLVGDTLHDHELAEALGCACVLFTGGHQSEPRLQASRRPLVDALSEILNHV
jgi:phosphoglycolate phosphatase